MLRMAPDSKYYKSNAFKVAATRLALRCLAQQVELNKKSISFPEVFAPTVPTLQQLSTTGSLPKVKLLVFALVDFMEDSRCQGLCTTGLVHSTRIRMVLENLSLCNR